MDNKIYIAAHKPVELPHDDILTPIFVGALDKEDITLGGHTFLRDDSGEHISDKNPKYCELTALYWAWKNAKSDSVGLMHYRRFFDSENLQQLAQEVAASEGKKIIVPKKRKYYIESLYGHYGHTFDSAHLDLALELVNKTYPKLTSYLEAAYKSTFGYMFNMFILPWNLYDDYCNFLFPLMAKMEERIDESKLDAFNLRLYGRVSEILFTAWVFMLKDEGITIKEVPVKDLEPVNWPKKIAGFLAAKFVGKKYSKSW